MGLTAGVPSEDETYIKTLLEFASTKELVERILKEDARTRNSDKLLIYRVISHICRKYDKGLFIPFELFDSFPAYESVTRCRRKIQEQGKYLPTDPEVIKRRDKRERAVRDWAIVDKGGK